MAPVTFSLPEEDVVPFSQAEQPATQEKPIAPWADTDAPPVHTPQVIDSRAKKMDLGMSTDSPGYTSLYDSLRKGDEKRIRDRQNYQETLLRHKQGMEVLNKINLGRPMSDDEMRDILTSVANSPNPNTPEIITEKAYSRMLLQNAFQADMVKNITDAWEKGHPENLSMSFTLGQGVLARRQVLQSTLEDTQARASKQGYGSWAMDVAGGLALDAIGAGWAERTQVIPGQTFSGSPGSILKQQYAYLHSLPVPEMKKTVDKILSQMDPIEATTFAKGLLAWTDSDSWSTNFWAVANVATLGIGTLFGKLPKVIGNKFAPVEMLSEVEKKIMRAGKSPITADLSRPYADEFNVIANIERGMSTQTAPRDMNPYEIIKAKQGIREGYTEQTKQTGFSTPEGNYELRGNKTYREGAPAVSERTVYIPADSGEGLGDFLRNRAQTRTVLNEDGTLSISARDTPTSRWYTPDFAQKIPYTETPTTGAHPVEVGGSRNLFGSTVYNNTHVGGPISQVHTATEAVPNVIPGSIQSMERARPMTSFELAQFSDRLNKAVLPNQTELVTLGRAQAQVSTVLKDVIKAAEDSPPRLDKIQAAVGDTSGAAVTNVVRNPVMTQGGFEERMHGILNPTKFFADAGSFSREITTRIQETLTNQYEKLLAVKQGTTKVSRLSPEQLEAAALATEKALKERIPKSLASGVINVFRSPTADASNMHNLTVVLGKPDGTPFSSWDAANLFAVTRAKFGQGNFEIVDKTGKAIEKTAVIQHGAGHYISITKPIPDVLDDVAKVALVNEGDRAKSHWSHMFKWFNTAAPYTLPESNMAARHIVTHGTQKIQEVNKEVAQSIAALKGSLNKEGTEKYNMYLLFDKDRSFVQDGQIGRFAETLGEFESNYMAEFKRKPTEREATAYFSFRQLNDTNYIDINLGYYRDLARLGVEQHRFRGPKGEYTPYFLGKQVYEVPGQSSKSAGVYIQDAVRQEGKFYRTDSMPPEIQKDIKKGVKEGYLRIIQVASPGERPLSNDIRSGGDIVNFVVIKDSQTKPLETFMVPYHPGFHREYQASHYVKQAILSSSGGRVNYEGDKTLLGVMSSAEGENYAKKLNEAARLFNEDKLAEMKDFVGKNLPEDNFGYEDLLNKFKTGKLDPQEPFHVVESGTTVWSKDKAGLGKRYGTILEDEAGSVYNLMQHVDKRFVGSRDPALLAIKEMGSEAAPLYQLESSPLLDIMQSLNRTVSSSSHARFAQDYKFKAASQFIENFGPYMTKNMEELRKNPMFYLLNANENWNKSLANAQMIATGKAAKAQITQFLGMDSPDIKRIKWLQNEAISLVYDKAGQDASHFVSDNMIGRIQDPTVYARRVASHLTIGLYNPLQLANQAQSVTLAWGLAGMEGLKGTLGTIYSRQLSLTRAANIIGHYDTAISKAKVGWKEGWLGESISEYDRSGFGIVQGETSWRDDVFDPKLVSTAAGKFLDAGYVFFRGGERFARETAWHTAYLEYRKFNPTKVIDDVDRTAMLQRANQLNNDMTRAAATPIEQGIIGVPKMFWQYQERLFGMLNPFGTRRTTNPWKEGATWTDEMVNKARAYAVFAGMYGIPVTAGIPVAYWPMYETIRQYALENGYDWKPNSWSYLAMEGLPSFITATITGRDYVRSPPMGPGGISAFREAVHSDKGAVETFGKLIGGVAGQKLSEVLTPVVPAFKALFKWNATELPTFNDLEVAARSISTVNQAYRSVYAFNFRAFYTKAGREIVAPSPFSEGLDKLDATILTATGMVPRKVADTFVLQDTMKGEKKMKEEAEKEIKKEYRYALEAMNKKDEAAFKVHMDKVLLHYKGANFNPQEWQKIQATVAKELLPLAEQTQADFMLRRATPERAGRTLQNLGNQ
jgi:hypothetical protein